jgi:hypothetical protein
MLRPAPGLPDDVFKDLDEIERNMVEMNLYRLFYEKVKGVCKRKRITAWIAGPQSA